MNNLGVKAGAVGVALLLWLHVVTEKTYTYTFPASLKPTHLAESLVIATELPEQLQVKIRGKGKRLLWLLFSDIKITLDLQDAIQSKARFRLKISDVVIPRDLDVTVLEIMEPDYVDVNIERLAAKRIPIWPQLEVTPADGYVVVGSMEVTPDSATLSGPRSFVAHVETLFTTPAEVERARRPVQRELMLQTPQGTNVTVAPMKVVTEVDVQKLKRRVISDIPVDLLHVPSGKEIALDSPTVTLTVEGGAQLVASLTHDDFRISVDCRQAGPENTAELIPAIQTPPNVTWVDARPGTLRIIN